MRANVGNLGKYEEELFTNGRYTVEVTKVEHGQTSKGGDTTNLFTKVLEGPEMDSGEPSEGQSIFIGLNWPDASHKDGGKMAGRMLRSACEAAGVRFDETGFDEEDFFGTTFDIGLKMETYEGEARPKVKKFYPN